MARRHTAIVAIVCVLALEARGAEALAREPSLREAQAAAARLAGGTAEEEQSRLVRASRSHWLPALRAQLHGRDDQRFRQGEQRGYPLVDDGSLTSLGWIIGAVWDLPQLVYAREEVSLATAASQLARARQQALSQTRELYAARLLALQRALSSRPEERLAHWLEVLTVTAGLDGLTGGLFGAALERAQSEVDACMQSNNQREQR